MYLKVCCLQDEVNESLLRFKIEERQEARRIDENEINKTKEV